MLFVSLIAFWSRASLSFVSLMLTVLQNSPFYPTWGENVSGSCFAEGSFTAGRNPPPALPPPQAFCVSGELPASFSKFLAAFRSRSMTRPQR